MFNSGYYNCDPEERGEMLESLYEFVSSEISYVIIYNNLHHQIYCQLLWSMTVYLRLIEWILQ